MGRRRAEIMWRGPRKAPEKFRRKELHHLPSVRISGFIFFSFFLIEFFIFCELNV